MSEIGYHLSGCRITYLAECDPTNPGPTNPPPEHNCNPPFTTWDEEERKEYYSNDTSIWGLINEKDLDIRELAHVTSA